MTKMKYLQYLLATLILLIGSCTDRPDKVLPPYYLSAELDAPIEFAEGKIITSNGINFSNDGATLYISKPLQKTFRNGKPFMGIFRSEFKNGRWTNPELVEFENKIDAYHPVLSSNDQVLFFNSRSHPDSIDLSIRHNIWCSKKTKNSWSLPEMINGINSPYYDSYPTVARNNNLYFNSDRPGGKGGMDIYMSRFENGNYQEPVNIQSLNSPHSENDLVVDPDERFIIFNRYVDSTNELDLFVSYKDGNDWKKPIELNEINQPDEWELTPTLSPDGKYFFYELNGKIMQFELAKLLK